MDEDNSGGLNLAEFTKAVRAGKLDLTNDDIKVLFDAFDVNKDGNIAYDEF